ncbi:thioredoxin family protein [Geobacillus proteiniphilus]|uniref:Thioredoxin family protein n=1 Tax=Geobacillus proteiniphilus TaxID=860353 RepID=A0ABY9MIZ0_9BACL|nr:MULTISPECIES: thioredoxin family protein [Geobacillus]MED4972148.1 thioredoxin family protein [Geobacillus thermoleovorans]OPX00419.1 thiol reductase thioredoxin [Geobacillus sp. LEMMY01]QCK82237.1 thioredoxin [Geobacillus kaustophilus NBRC 102445]WMJ17816.1 thioredoxin family protein [Geobacillus proteiniphilus]
MRGFVELTDAEMIDRFIEANELAFLFISSQGCGVCQALYPKVIELMDEFPFIQLGHVVVDDVKEIAGRFSIFTAPVLLLFVNGKEVLREARFVHMDLLREKVTKIYKLVID